MMMMMTSDDGDDDSGVVRVQAYRAGCADGSRQVPVFVMVSCTTGSVRLSAHQRLS